MWENIQFSARIVLPSFILIFLGRMITLKKLLTPEQMDKIGKLTFTYLLSTKIFLDIIQSSFDSFQGAGFAVYCMFATVAVFLASWILGAKLLKRKESVPSFVQSCFRCSFTVLGLSMVESFAGGEGVARAMPLLTLTVIVFNILASIVLTKPGENRTPKTMLLRTVKSILKNPLIIAVELGLVVILTGIELPYLVAKPLEQLGDMAAPLSLLCIGSSLNGEKVRHAFKYALAAACVKTWGAALVFVPLAVLLGYRGFELTVIALFLTAANPSANYVMALATDNDSELAASGLVLSTVMCIFTSMGAMTILRAFGLI